MSNCFEVTSKFGNICSFKSDSVNKGDKVYTSPQTKPLSDEEIWKVGESLGWDFKDKSKNNVFLKFAKAIEERHGIK